MFPHTGGGSWRSSLFPQDGSMPHPRDPRTAARANYPSNHQAYEAGSGWTQGWPNPAQWGYPCQQVPTPPYQSGWIPNVAPQPGVNCPPVGVPPPGVNWSGFPVVSYPVGQEENQNKEGGGDHVKNGCPEGSDLSLFLSHYCNPKPARHLVPVSIADKEQGVPDAKASVDSNDSENKSLLEKMDSAVKEGTKEQFADEKDGASKNTGIDLSRETPASPTSLEGDFLLEKVDQTPSMKRKVVSIEKPDSTSSKGEKRLILENSNCTPSEEGLKSPFDELDSLISMGRKGAAVEKPDSATSTWTGSLLEKTITPGKPERTVTVGERGVVLGKSDRTFSSTEKGMSLGKSERTASSRESMGRSDRAASSREANTSLGKHDWATVKRERRTSLEKLDRASFAHCDRAPYTADPAARKNACSDSASTRTSTPVGEEADTSHQTKTNIKANKDANRTDLQDLLITVAQEVGENNPDARTAAVLRKKEEIEREYEQNCRTFFLVAAMLLEREPSIEQTVVSALRKTLRELSKQCEQELQNFIERYDRGIIRC
ncbi:uncharacterized protein [Pleurodeles waltl]|uniref:uncharacterized protein isoform X1 n=1 Tax=Pleurodeles waltl TaxID=8319 RepID=UPI00370973F7